MSTSIELFVDDADGVESVGLVLRAASVVEYEGELVPGCKLTAQQTRRLIYGLEACVAEMECG